MIAEYHEVDVFRGNPYVEALPPMLSGGPLIDALSNFPEYQDADRDKPAGARLQLLSNLTEFYQPLPMSLTLYSQIYLNMQRSFGRYGGRDAQAELVEGYKSVCSGDAFISGGGGNSFSLVGVSGLGKSVAIQRALSLFPKYIQHTEYHGEPFCNTQIPYLVVQTPHDCSVKSMCVSVLAQVDEIVGTHYYKPTTMKHVSTAVLVNQIAQISRCLHIGMLIVDEVQNLAYNSRGARGIQFLNFLVQLINESSLSVCLVGTPQVYELLRKEFRAARRATGLLFDRLKNNSEFELLARGLWHYQYTKTPTSFTPEIHQWLYRKSQGIPDVLTKLIYFGQHYAIMSGREKLDLPALEHALEENLYILDGFSTSLETPGRKSSQCSCSDIVISPMGTGRTAQKEAGDCFIALYRKAVKEKLSCEELMEPYIKDEVEVCPTGSRPHTQTSCGIL